MGSLTPLLELLCVFILYNPLTSILSLSLPVSLFPLCHPVSRLAANGSAVIAGSPCVTGVCGECLVLPIVVPVTAVASALTLLHIRQTNSYQHTLMCL